MLSYFQGDERPSWVATITVNGASDDYTTGHTFTVKVATARSATAALTKTTGITGGTGGTVTVAWAANELNLTPGLYVAQLTVNRTADSAELTVEETLEIIDRML